MSKKYLFLLLLFPIGSLAVFTAQTQQTIRVAVAANLALPMQEVKKVFEASHPDISVEIISASSGKLTAQIDNYAPFHIFISADMHYPQSLYSKGVCSQAPAIIAYGKLICWSKLKITKQIPNEHTLTNMLQSAKIKNIAIAEPELAPYGDNTKRWMEQQGVWEMIKSKVVYGENVGKVNQYIYSGSVDIAFTAASASYSPQLANKGSWVPIKDWQGIPHGGMILDYGLKDQPTASKSFFNFLVTERAGKIFKDFGYSIEAN